MSSLNVVMLIGHLGREPEVRQLPSGKPVANFSMATSLKWKNGEGTLESKTDWHRVVAFGNLAEVVRSYLHKGKQVFVEGRLQTRSYTDKSGARAFSTEIILQRMLMLGKKEPTAQTDAEMPVEDELEV